ncbi:MAG: gamma-glutamyl-gamma-aminobutyrate hydrolase family protein [Vicinamibacteria bacterium]|nr:gamma-glutamyl-gamma-aminobutyrate hydrolase family protein [Vicinamibacteria bacterium]
MRPAVAVTSGDELSPGDGFYLRKTYIRAVESAGALPFIVVPGRPADVSEILAFMRGLFLTGGGDIDPALYERDAHPTLDGVSHERDAFEIALVKAALTRDLPVLAVCRGLQILNVACGGRIIQDIASEIPGAVEHQPGGDRRAIAHEVELLHETRIRAILGTNRVAVSSTHHQAVDTLGDGLVVSARSPADGIIEGIESPNRRFVVGVQWHPEDFWDMVPGFAPLFSAWVQACAEN